MARARNIKPKFFTDSKLGKADIHSMVLFASLWCLADREGRLVDEPDEIWAQTFPYRPQVNTDELLNELHEKGFIVRYEVGELKIIQVKRFKEHQTPHIHEKKSVLPPCDDNSLINKGVDKCTVQTPDKHVPRQLVKRSDSLIADSLIPDSLIPDSKHSAKKVDLDFERFWNLYPKRPGANKTQAAKAWQARLREGHPPDQIILGTIRYAAFCKQQRTEPQYVKQAATFLGPDKHFELPWEAVVGRNSNQSFADKLTGRKGDDDDFTIDA